MQRTSDYGLIAYLSVVCNIEPSGARKIRRGKMEYDYDLEESKWTEIRVAYSKSQFPLFLHAIKVKQDPSF